MSVLLLTMGPQLGVVMETPVLRVGEPGTIKFHAPGAVGQVKWSVVESDLPAEWGAITPDDAEATISTAEALEWGEYTFTVRAVDSQRAPVARTFSVWVEPAAIVVADGGAHEWNVGVPISLLLSITGGTGAYIGAYVASGDLPAGVSASLVGDMLQITGTPTTVSSDSVVVVVRDSREAQGVTSINWEVSSPPKILIGGGFTVVNGSSKTYLARLNLDGTLDATFDAGLSSSVTFISVRRGYIGVAGAFTSVSSVPRQRVAVLNEDGTLYPSFSCTQNNAVNGMVPYSSDKWFIFGNFTVLNGSSVARCAILNSDGTIDTAFSLSACDGAIRSAYVLPNGKILVSGEWANIGGSAIPRLALLNTDGTVDTAFSPAFSGTYVYGFRPYPGGKILAFGRISSVFSTSVVNLVRLNADLTLDTSFLPSFYHPNSAILAAVATLSGDVVAVGGFSDANGVTRNRIAWLGGTNGNTLSVNPGANNTVHCVEQLPDGAVFYGGSFTVTAGTSRTRLAKVSAAGVLDSGFTPTASATVPLSELQYL